MAIGARPIAAATQNRAAPGMRSKARYPAPGPGLPPPAGSRGSSCPASSPAGTWVIGSGTSATTVPREGDIPAIPAQARGVLTRPANGRRRILFARRSRAGLLCRTGQAVRVDALWDGSSGAPAALLRLPRPGWRQRARRGGCSRHTRPRPPRRPRSCHPGCRRAGLRFAHRRSGRGLPGFRPWHPRHSHPASGARPAAPAMVAPVAPGWHINRAARRPAARDRAPARSRCPAQQTPVQARALPATAAARRRPRSGRSSCLTC